MRKAIVVALLFATACSSGPDAPAVGELQAVCNDAFCVDVPDGWDAEVGESYLSFNHTIDPNHTFLTVGFVDMEAIVEASGGTWPVPTEDAARAFWALLEESEAGEFKRSARLVGGAIKSWGSHSDGDMWYLLSPIEGSRGIGIEMRAPNGSWESHADAVFNSLTVSE